MNKIMKKLYKQARTGAPVDEQDVIDDEYDTFLWDGYELMNKENDKATADIVEKYVTTFCKEKAAALSERYDYLDYDKLYKEMYDEIKARL